MIRSMEGRINSWNQSAAELYGWRKEEAIGRISHELLQTRFPKPLEEIESELVRNGLWEGHLVHTTRDGGRVVVKSRWALDLEGESEAVVEINRPSPDYEINPDARLDTPSEQVGKRKAVPTRKYPKEDGLVAKITNIVLGGGAFYCVLVLFYILYHYGWTAERHFSDSISQVLFYFVPLSVAGFLFASLRFKLSHKINIALLGASLAISILGMELFLQTSGSTLFGQAKPVMTLLDESNERSRDAAELTRKLGVKIDPRTGGEVIADLRKEGVDAVPIVTVSNNLFIKQPDGSIKSAVYINGREIMPLAGVSNKVTVLCNENGQWITYGSDERGFNNPNEIWRSNRLEIAALGDSFAHGYCVPADRNFVALLRQRYPATLNLGVAGDGPLLMLATLKEYLPFFKPKTVLWFYYEGNDLTDLQSERKSGLLMNYFRDGFSQNGLSQQSTIDRAILDDLPRQRAIERANRQRREANRRAVIDKLLNFAKLPALRQRLGVLGGMTADEIEMAADFEGPNLNVFRDTLSQAKSRVDAWGGRLYFVYLPEWARYTDYSSWGGAKRNEVLTLVNDLGIPLIDIDLAFHASGDPLALFPFREVGHYNETGHRLVAQEILKVISKSDDAPR
jgi:PAS domain S-box-containing protein